MPGDGDGAGAGASIAERWPIVYACWKMSRPSQLALIAVVYTLGTVIAVARGSALNLFDVTAGFAVLLPVAASIHYANEYADYETDALTRRTPFSGGSGGLQETGLPARLALRAAGVSLGVGLGAAAICLHYGVTVPPLLILGGIAVVGWLYSLPPLALVWRGFGEPTNAVLGGLALPLYGYAVQADRVAMVPMLACLPFTILVFINLLETHWPDRCADAKVGKSTLPTRWSRTRLRWTYGLGIGAYLLTLGLLWGRVLPRPVALASLVVLPLLGWGAFRYTRRELPLPAVLAMVLLAIVQVLAWGSVADLP
ncbi:MAG: 1,4-dihydroxy-2-naphthoate octaprenyltransferase [Halobacteriales archaeon]|jgi:1,4-dihydroxy-2-naphthoate octaprenyltransferase